MSIRSRLLSVGVPLLVLILVSMPVHAQAGRIVGRLVDITTGEPVAGATVELVGARVRTQTDEGGSFQLDRLRPGRYLLQVTHIAYGTHADSVTVPSTESPVVVSLRVSPRALELEPLEVEAQSRPRSGASPTNVIGRDRIESMIGRAQHIGDVVQALIPGARYYVGRAGLICLEFRAAAGSRTRGCNFPVVVVDDIPVGSPAVFLRDTPIEDIERLEFIPASEASARYGMGSQNGALVVTTRRSGIEAGPAAQRATSHPLSYQWQLERRTHPWARALAGSTAGNVLGLTAGLAALGCFSGDDGLGSGCIGHQSTGAGFASLLLPLAGAAAGAKLFGGTERSSGNPLLTAMVTAVPLALGYAMYVDGERNDLPGSRSIGGALVIVGTPLMATIADGIFRHVRGASNRGSDREGSLPGPWRR